MNTRNDKTHKTRMAFVAPDDWTIWLFYRHLINALVDNGVHVTAISSPGRHVKQLESIGVEHLPTPYARFVDPVTDIQLYARLKEIFRSRQFDLVQNVTIKANVFGALAAWHSGIRYIINTVEGAGLLYGDHVDFGMRGIRAIAEIGLRAVRPHVTCYWFVNSRDKEVFVRRSLATPEKSVVAVATGVDLEEFHPKRTTPEAVRDLRVRHGIADDRAIVISVAGRLLKSKGIIEFIEMARLLRESGALPSCVLVGPEESRNHDAIDISIVRGAVDQGLIHWVGFAENISSLYAMADIVVVPTYYAEGTPKGVMEGMAAGKAVVCSDIPSIREMVRNGEDAVVVKPRMPDVLAEAVQDLLNSPDTLNTLGRNARRTAEIRFDAQDVANRALVSVYSRVLEWNR